MSKQQAPPGDIERKAKVAANASEALRRLKTSQTYEDWRQVGALMLIITEETLNDLGLDVWDQDNKKLTREFTKRFEGWQRTVSNATPITKQERWALREIMTKAKYHAWYSTEVVGLRQRRCLNHPNAIINAYKRKHPDAAKVGNGSRRRDGFLPVLRARSASISPLKAELEEGLASRPTAQPSEAGEAGPVTRIQRLADDLNNPDNWPAHIAPTKRRRLHKSMRELLTALRDAFASKERRDKTVKAPASQTWERAAVRGLRVGGLIDCWICGQDDGPTYWVGASVPGRFEVYFAEDGDYKAAKPVAADFRTLADAQVFAERHWGEFCDRNIREGNRAEIKPVS